MNTKELLKPLNNESGMVLVVAILIMSALILLGSTAVMESTTDLRIAGNYKTGAIAFYAAEAGIEEARARMVANFTPTTGATGYIDDPVSNHTNLAWSVSIGGAGPYTSIQSALSYTVSIVHQKNAANEILYWGDANGDGKDERTPSPTSSTGIANKNIYLVTSNGVAANANKTIEVEMTRFPPINVPGALYVESTLQVSGSSQIIANLGTTECGSASGVATTMPYNAANPPVAYNLSQPDKILGVNGAGELGIRYGTPDMDISATADNIKDSANYTYTVSGNPTIAGAAWGTPTTDAPSTCSESNVIYYNSTDGLGINLHNSSGCGTLIVNGPLRVDGNFSWYGLIITTGSITYIGTGNKNVTGAILSGGGVITDSIGGNAQIIYCSSAISNATQNMPLKKLSWRDNAF